jgi:hypothetical protein
MRTRPRRFFAVGLAVLAIAAIVAPVSAKPLVREHYSDSDAGEWSCGDLEGLTFEATFEGVFSLKEGRAGDPTPYLTDNYHWEYINRNPANGKWFREEGQGQYKDLQITNLGGTLYRFIAQESGPAFTIYTSDGRKLVVDHGLLRYQFDVDTLGDDDLENDIHFDDTFLLTADHGSHPVWHMTGDEYCAIVQELLG